MTHGRQAGLTLAAGVISGSLFWGVMAATGVSALLARFAEALFVLKILGGLYLLYLAVKALRNALRPDTGGEVATVLHEHHPSASALYWQGLLMHVANPKAVLAWIALVTLGIGPGAGAGDVATILLGCAILSVLIFGGYAIIFSTAPMVRFYRRARRHIEGVLALFFGAAGLRLLMSRA